MPESKQRTTITDLFMTTWIIIRVGLILVVWLALFLALFLGYFTVPIIVVVVLSGIYTITDAAFFVANRRRNKAQMEREELMKEIKGPDDNDPVV